METRVHYAVVGAVVFSLLVALVSFLVWVSQSGKSVESRLYTIYFREFSLAGLQVNSNVTMRGIKVGSVESLLIDTRDNEQVRVVIRLQEDTPVRVDSRALIERNLLTGLASIEVTSGTKNAQQLLKTPQESYPVIPEGRATLAQIQSDLPSLFERINSVADRLNNTIDEKTQADLKVTIKNLRLFSETLAAQRQDLTETLRELPAIVVALREASAEVSETVRQIREPLISLPKTVDTTAKDLQRLSRTAEQVLRNYEKPRSFVFGNREQEEAPGE